MKAEETNLDNWEAPNIPDWEPDIPDWEPDIPDWEIANPWETNPKD